MALVVLPEDRRSPRHAILGKIVMGEVAAAVVLLPDDGLSDIAVEEEPRAILREPCDGLGKISVAECLAGFEQRASGRENLRNAGGRVEDRGDDGEEVSLERRERETSARGAHRWLNQPFHRQAAKRLMHGEDARHDAWGGARAQADMELLLGRAEIGMDGIEVDLA